MKTINVTDQTFQAFRTMKAEIIGQIKQEISDDEALATILLAVHEYKHTFVPKKLEDSKQ